MRYKKLIKLGSYLIFLSFLFSYIASQSGYYEYHLQNKRNLTKEEIKKFEQDIKDGKDIDIKNYMKESRVDYSNNLTKAASNFSINLNKHLKNTLNTTFTILEKLIK